MSQDARRFLTRGLIFSIPFLLYGLVVVSVDPFNYFRTGSLISDDLKRDISLKVNYAMWKIFEYRRTPVSNLLLGDSRMMLLDQELVSRVAGEPYYNFAYGGGSLREAIDTFWLATEYTDLKTVYIGLNLDTFNGSDTKDRVSEVRAALHNPLLYFTNNNVLLAGQKLIQAEVSGKTSKLGVPDMDKNLFWDRQLNNTTKIYLSNYRYPEAYLEELREISTYCHENVINLNFLIFPNHVDLQKKLADYHLLAENIKMRQDLSELGRVLDFSFASPLASARENYVDPFHFNTETMRRIVDIIWHKFDENVKVGGTSTVDGR